MVEEPVSVVAYCVSLLWLPLSWLVDLVLRIRYSRLHAPSSRPLPSARFVWPNSQGTAKFFDGHKAAVQWRHEFGPLYRIWDGTRPEIVLTKPHHLQQYYRRSHEHVKSIDNNTGWLFHEILGSCVGVVSRDQWKNLRRAVDGPFTRPAAISHTAMILAHVQRYLSSLLLLLPFERGQTHPVMDPVNDLKSCAFYVVAEIFLGELSPAQRTALKQLAPSREDLFKHAFKGGVHRYWWLRYWPGSVYGDLQRFQRRWETFVLEAYTHAQQQPAPQAPIVGLWNRVMDGQISKVEVLQTLDEALFANLDVTAIAVSWTLIHLGHHPDVQEAVRKELEPFRADSVQYQQYLNRDDTLLAWCVLESARLKPILPFSNPESATEDHIIDGYTVPSTVDVIIDTHAVNVANPFWGPNTDTYDPYRFQTVPSSQLRYNMWRFGTGPRKCLGKDVADRLLRAIAAEMVALFALEPETEAAIDVKEESWIGLPDTKLRLQRKKF